MPVEVDYASEFRYRDPLIGPGTLVAAVTQSGETVDTLAALEEGREKGASLLGIVNVLGSMASRVCDDVLYTHAGPEIGVASTKAFTSQLCALYMLAVYLGRRRGTCWTRQPGSGWFASWPTCPTWWDASSAEPEPTRSWPPSTTTAATFSTWAAASSIPSPWRAPSSSRRSATSTPRAIRPGEMKHGPIALIDEHMPVVALMPQDHVYEKMVSQVEQVRARGGKVMAVANRGDEIAATRPTMSSGCPSPRRCFSPS